MPHEGIKKKICAFLDTPTEIFDQVILKSDIEKWKGKKDAKELARSYDFFIASAPLMSTIATLFGKILGPLGKMPDPKAGGVLMRWQEQDAKQLAERLKKTVRVKTKEASIKAAIGKESQDDNLLAENAEAVYNTILNALPKKKENLKSVIIKFTMSKPIRVKV